MASRHRPESETVSAATLVAMEAFYRAGGQSALRDGDMPKVIDAFRAVVEVILRGSGPAASATTTTQVKALLSADQAAEVLGLGTSTVRAMMASGRLKYVRVGKGRKISPQEIDRFISQHEKFAGEEE